MKLNRLERMALVIAAAAILSWCTVPYIQRGYKQALTQEGLQLFSVNVRVLPVAKEATGDIRIIKTVPVTSRLQSNSFHLIRRDMVAFPRPQSSPPKWPWSNPSPPLTYPL